MSSRKMGRNILWSNTVIRVDGNIWISLLECNGLVKVDMNTGTLQFVDFFKYENNRYQLHGQIVFYQYKLIFVPFNASNIAIFNLEKEKLHYLPVNSSGKAARFWSAVTEGKYLYMSSYDSIQVVKMDMEAEKIINSFELFDDCSGYDFPPMKLENGIYKISGTKKKDNLSWKFDFEKEELSLCEYTFARNVDLIAGCRGNNFIWIIGDNNILYQLTGNRKCIKQYDLSKIICRVMKDTKAGLLSCICYESVLIIIFYDKYCMVKIPFMENVLGIEKSEYIKFDSAFFTTDGNDLIVMLDNSIIIMNDNEEREVNIIVDTNFFEDISVKNWGRFQELDVYEFSLERYIEYVCDIERHSLLGNSSADVSKGKAIYNVIKTV